MPNVDFSTFVDPIQEIDEVDVVQDDENPQALQFEGQGYIERTAEDEVHRMMNLVAELSARMDNP